MYESRRDFLKRLGAMSALTIASVDVWSMPHRSAGEPLQMLVVGDSFIWGQGLDERDKIYTHTAEWLRRDAFGTAREVRLKVKAHSGSTIKFHEDEAAAYKKAGRDESHYYDPEVNVGFPSIWRQVEIAADEYSAAGVSHGADVILVSGGITDISVAKLLDPFTDEKLLPPIVEKYCGGHIFDLLAHAGTIHPKALIAVVGYFPIVSPKTDGGKLFNGWLESMAFPRALKSFANNPLTRSVFFRRVRKETIQRSRTWFKESNRHMAAAVDKFNVSSKGARAVFVTSPITEDTCIETPDTLLFRMGKGGRTEDALFSERLKKCRLALPELKHLTGLDYPVRHCEIAAFGHPNPDGARAYANAINAELARELAQRPI